jgi:hypothetical protein
MKKPKGAQKGFLNEILGISRTTSKEQTETIECIKAWKGRFFEQPTLLPIHEETLGFRKMPCFSKKIERPVKKRLFSLLKQGGLWIYSHKTSALTKSAG